jgi:ribosome-associated protein
MPQPSPSRNENRQFKKTGTSAAADTQKLVDVIGEGLLENKAENITVLDVHELTTLTDRFVVCHATTRVQIKAIVNSVIEATKEQLNEKPWQEEGRSENRWVILDYVNVVVHVFKKELRDYYALEQIWGDADIVTIEDKEG